MRGNELLSTPGRSTSLTAQPGTTVHVTVSSDDVTVASDNAEPSTRSPDTTSPSDDVLRAAIQRLERSGTSRNIREALDGLRVLGYDLIPAKTHVPGKAPENYLRIIDPRHKTYGVGYLTPSYFAFSRVSDRERLLDLPGADPITGAVKFSHVESAQPGLAAAKLLKS
jgi:hypothetical protein